MSYDNEDRGGLWPIRKDKRRDNGPNVDGKITLSAATMDKLRATGGELYISAWTKDSSGKKWLSISVDSYRMDREAAESQAGTATVDGPPAAGGFEDESIPF